MEAPIMVREIQTEKKLIQPDLFCKKIVFLLTAVLIKNTQGKKSIYLDLKNL